jgi:hypothetical protein
MSGPVAGGGGNGNFFGNLFGGGKDESITQNIPGYTIVRLPGKLQMLPGDPNTSTGVTGNIFTGSTGAAPGVGLGSRHVYQFRADTPQGQQERQAVNQRIQQLKMGTLGNVAGATYTLPGWSPTAQGYPVGQPPPVDQPGTSTAVGTTDQPRNLTERRMAEHAALNGVTWKYGMDKSDIDKAIWQKSQGAPVTVQPGTPAILAVPENQPGASDMARDKSERKLAEHAALKGVAWKYGMSRSDIDLAALTRSVADSKINAAGASQGVGKPGEVPDYLLTKAQQMLKAQFIAAGVGDQYSVGKTPADLGTIIDENRQKAARAKRLEAMGLDPHGNKLAPPAAPAPGSSVTAAPPEPAPPVTSLSQTDPAAAAPPSAPPTGTSYSPLISGGAAGPASPATPGPSPPAAKSQSVLDYLSNAWHGLTGNPGPPTTDMWQQRKPDDLGTDMRYNPLGSEAQ